MDSETRSRTLTPAPDVALLARLLIIFATIKIVAAAIGFLVAMAAVEGKDADGSRTLFWVPQILFYLVYLLSARRLLRGEIEGRRRIVSLSVLGLLAEVLYTVAVFVVGPGRERPALAFAMELRLLASGDVWDLVFLILAVVRLRARPGDEAGA